MKIFCVIIILLLLFVIIESMRESKIYVKKILSLTSEKVDGNIKFIYISDYHDSDDGSFIDKLIKIIDEEKIDKIVFGGDMVTIKKRFTSGIKQNDFAKLVSSLKNKNVKMYYSYGNHEMRTITMDVFKNKFKSSAIMFNKLIEENGIELIDNKYVDIGNNVRLYGLFIDMDLYKMGISFKSIKKRMNEEYLSNHIGKLDKKYYNIVVCHNPNYAENCIDYGFDTVLSGHLHGGLVNIPFIGAAISPEFVLFPKYGRGLYKYDDKNIIVSSGVGGHSYNIRVNNYKEIYVINIGKYV